MTGARTPGSLLVGLDVGGSKLATLVTTAGLQPVARHVRERAPDGPGPEPGEVVRAIEEALALAGAGDPDLGAIGIGVPGRVEPETGRVSLAVNLGWNELPLGSMVRDRFGVPVALENDVRAAAAALHARRVVPDDDLAYLSIGTGISAGLVFGGRAHRGVRGLAGEVGHVVLDPEGPACPCGLRGCFEALASGRAIGLAAEAALRRGRTGTLAGGRRPPTALDVYREAAAGDPLALELAEAAGRWIARGIHELLMTCDVSRVVLGGGVTRAGRPFLDPVMRALDLIAGRSPLARQALGPDVVHLLPPDADAGAWGGVILARGALGSEGEPAASTATTATTATVGRGDGHARPTAGREVATG